MALTYRTIEEPTIDELTRINELLSRYDLAMPDLRMTVFSVVEDEGKIIMAVAFRQVYHPEPWVIDRSYLGKVDYEKIYESIEQHAAKYRFQEYIIMTPNEKIANRLSKYGMTEFKGHTMQKVTPW